MSSGVSNFYNGVIFVYTSTNGWRFVLPKIDEQKDHLAETQSTYRHLNCEVERFIRNYESSVYRANENKNSVVEKYQVEFDEKQMLDVADWAERSLVHLTKEAIQGRYILSTKWLQSKNAKIDPNLSDADKQFYSLVDRLQNPELFDRIHRVMGDQLTPETSELISGYLLEKNS